jgi:hypothetical protein
MVATLAAVASEIASGSSIREHLATQWLRAR